MTPSDFRPLWPVVGPHAQTLLGSLLPGAYCPRGTRLVVRLADGDALLLHENTPPGWHPGRPAALLVHGLTGSHRSGHSQRMAVRLLGHGWRTYRIDLRGAGDGVGLARRTYPAGGSEDLRAALAVIRGRCPGSAVGLIAVSLGGNMALKLAAEGEQLAALVALNPPIDLERCSRRFERPENRFYERRFVRDLIANVEARRRRFPDLPAAALDVRMSLRAFDDAYTGPVNGFRDAAHYYRESSALPLIGRIGARTLIVTARDDPFIDPGPFDELTPPPGVTVRVTERGGHVGFVGWGGGWAERAAVAWLAGAEG
ncbi:MAG: YheT family hydrolase [Gemmataceae bacterium]